MQIVIDMSSDTYTRVCAGEVVGHHLHELYNSVRNGKELAHWIDDCSMMTREAIQKEMFIAKRVIDAIDNFNELKIAYDEEKQVIREALVRFIHRICAIADINEEGKVSE